jgi:hypothetical protein
MTAYRVLILLVQASGLALLGMAWQPRTLRTVWPAAACLTGTLLGLPIGSILVVTALAAALTWPVRLAWAL